MPVPMVAVRKPSRKVFHIASRVAENSKNTKLKLYSVSVAQVSGSETLRVSAVFSSARYGRITVSDSTMNAKAMATGFQRPSRVIRGSPLLPPSTV